MNTKKLALITVFVALTAAINLYAPKIPFPIAPFLYYNLWEIPIVVAFLIFGPKIGAAVAGLNTVILLIYFPGSLPTGPMYNLIAELSMLIGVYAAYKISTYRCPTEKISTFLKTHKLSLTISTTTLGIISRVAITTASNYLLIGQPSPIGFGSFFQFGGKTGQEAVLAFLPFSAIFNATLALYTIPVAIAIAIVVVSVFNVQ